MTSLLQFAARVAVSGPGATDAAAVPLADSLSWRDTSLSALLRPALRRLAGLAAAGAYAWFLWGLAAGDRDSDWSTSLPGVVLALGATLTLLVMPRYKLAVAALVLSLAGAAFTDVLLATGAVGHWLLLLAVLGACVLSGPAVALLAAAALAGAALAAAPWPAAWPLVRACLTGAGIVWALGSSLYEALAHSQRSEAHAWQRAGEAMARRGEWQRASKALHDMYSLLERTNRELEMARREAEEARETKARFAANVSHELRTPLNLIMGFSRIMHRSPSVYGAVNWTPQLRSDIRQIYDASRHLLGMIDDILDLSRIEAQRLPLKLERVTLARLLEEAADTARGLLRDSPVSLNVKVAPDLPQLMLDQTRIRQVLLNLLGNAIRFTDHGEITLSAWAGEGEVYVQIQDTGVGISAEDLPGVFDEFSQAGGDAMGSRGGAGLGLAVCRQLIMLHGGRISAESEPGKGSTFRFALPVSRPSGGRARLAYYAPDGWSPPLPKSPGGATVVALCQHESAARALARGLPNLRVLPVLALEALPAVVETEHPLGVVIAKDPLAASAAPDPAAVWAATGRPDLSVAVCDLPLNEAARAWLGVDAFLPKPVQPEDLADEVRRLRPRARRLLVVDDDPGFLALVERAVLSTLPGISVEPCRDGQRALALAREARFDVVVLDLVMPRLGGREFLRLAREEGLLVGAAIVVATGAPVEEELAAALPAKLTFQRQAPPRNDRWLESLAALFASAPPDYCTPPRRLELAAAARP